MVHPPAASFCSLVFAMLPMLAQEPPPPPAPPVQVELAPLEVLTAWPGLGDRLPAPRFGAWLRGEPIELGAPAAPAVTVFVFPGSTEPLAASADVLRDLQVRFAERQVAFAVVVGAPEAAVPASLQNCRVVVDPARATAVAWGMAEPAEALLLVAADRQGHLVYFDALRGDLVDAVEAQLAGRFDAVAMQEARQLRRWCSDAFDDLGSQEAWQALAKVRGVLRHDGLSHGLAYLVAAIGLGDREAALAVRREAVERLADLPRELAVFADLALRGDPRSPELAGQLLVALQPATALADLDPVVQLAQLRALVAAGRDKEVPRHAARVRKVVQGTAAGCLEFAALLANAGNAAVHRDLAAQSLARAKELGAEAQELLMVDWLVATRCAEDAERAKVVFEAFAAEAGARVSLNNACWYLMTQLPTLGRFDRFAEALAERMLQEREAMDDFEFDTAALAMFRAGRFAAAVELQQIAVQKGGGGGNPEYGRRLARYEAAMAAGR